MVSGLVGSSIVISSLFRPEEKSNFKLFPQSYLMARVAFAKDAVNYNEVRNEIAKILDSPEYDDGSYGPLLVRLAWHASGTFDKRDGSGGSNGAKMRHSPEKDHGANSGLQLARNLLEPIKKKYPDMSYADLWTLAGAVAIEEMGGPKIPWRPGRSDVGDGKTCTSDGRLPDATKGQDHIRDIFSRMGFNDKEMVALIGAHALGRCHTDRSGFKGPWTHSPITVSNHFYTNLLEKKWTKKSWNGPPQYEDESKELMMLPADLALLADPIFRKHVELYAKDEEAWFKDFSAAFAKLLELGVPFSPDTKPYTFDAAASPPASNKKDDCSISCKILSFFGLGGGKK